MLGGLQPLMPEKRLQRRKDAKQESLRGLPRDTGLQLQTPQLAYHASHKGLPQTTSENPETSIPCGSNLVMLNAEIPVFQETCTRNEKERRLATRHGFPVSNRMTLYHDAHVRKPPSRQESEKWTIQMRHSISSQVCAPLPRSPFMRVSVTGAISGEPNPVDHDGIAQRIPWHLSDHSGGMLER